MITKEIPEDNTFYGMQKPVQVVHSTVAQEVDSNSRSNERKKLTIDNLIQDEFRTTDNKFNENNIGSIENPVELSETQEEQFEKPFSEAEKIEQSAQAI